MDSKSGRGLYISVLSLGAGLYMPMLFFFIYMFNRLFTDSGLNSRGLIILLVLNFLIMLASMSGFLYGLTMYSDEKKEEKVPEVVERRSSIPEEREELEELMRVRDDKN